MGIRPRRRRRRKHSKLSSSQQGHSISHTRTAVRTNVTGGRKDQRASPGCGTGRVDAGAVNQERIRRAAWNTCGELLGGGSGAKGGAAAAVAGCMMCHVCHVCNVCSMCDVRGAAGAEACGEFGELV
jgi:hypothetical protein